MSLNNIPAHIGIIMDGNRRWAKKKGLPPILGHKKGGEALENIIEIAAKRGISILTIFAFSKENWKRTEEEVKGLISLFEDTFITRANEVAEKGARVNFIGRIEDFPVKIQEQMHTLQNRTINNTKITVNLAMSYGGHAEIVDATKRIIKDGLKPEEITEDKFAEYIYEAGQPNPELIIRTGGMPRISGFMLWQSAYSEMYFTSTLWPDFNEVELDKALKFYEDIKRNFGE